MKTTKYAHEYGQRWLAQVPRTSIGWLVDRLHVSTTDDEITAEIIRRISLHDQRESFTPAIGRQTIRYALLRHQHNRDLYARVVRGTPMVAS